MKKNETTYEEREKQRERVRREAQEKLNRMEEANQIEPDYNERESKSKSEKVNTQSYKKNNKKSNRKNSNKKNKKRKKQTNKEFARITTAFVCLFIGMMGYLVYFQVVKSNEIVNSPYNPRQNLLEEHVVRGKILDHNGQVLSETKVDAEGEEYRSYPYGSIFAHVVGYETKGKMGLELSENFKMLKSNAFFIDKIRNEFTEEKNPGDNIVTTLDASLQSAAYDALGDNKGVVIVSEANTGKILTMVSKPSFDPNKLNEDWDTLNQSEDSQLYNRATKGLYPPGSVFKIVTILEYMRSNPNYADYEYECQGHYEQDGTRISCYQGTVHGKQNIEQIFANSCNTGFIDMGLSLNMDSYRKTAENLLFNQKLPGNMQANTSSFALNKHSEIPEIMMTVMGQGKTMVSPYHMHLITAGIANGGKLMEPYLVERIENNSGSVVRSYKPSLYKNLMSADEAQQLSEYMEAVVGYGTASSIQSSSYSLAGKTGTAEYSSDKSQSHSWFVGFTNPENPELVITVMLEKSDGRERASNIAKRVLDAFYK